MSKDEGGSQKNCKYLGNLEFNYIRDRLQAFIRI